MTKHRDYVEKLYAEMVAAGWTLAKDTKGEQRSVLYFNCKDIELMFTVEHGMNDVDLIRVFHKSDTIKTNSCVYPLAQFSATVISNMVRTGRGYLPTEAELKNCYLLEI